MSSKRYTEEQKDLICKMYMETRSITQIKKVIPADWVTIRAILIKNGIYNPYPQKFRRFTKDEKSFILANHPKKSCHYIATILNCTPKGVSDFLKTKGLYKAKPKKDFASELKEMAAKGMTIRQAANTLGVNYSSLQYYIRKDKISFDRASPWANRKAVNWQSSRWLTEDEKNTIIKTYLNTQKLIQTAKSVTRDIWTVRSFLIREGIYKHRNYGAKLEDRMDR
jgi:transposase-like protein